MRRSDERHGFSAGLKRVRAGSIGLVIAAATALLGGCHDYGGASVPIEGDEDWRTHRPVFEGATPVADDTGDLDNKARR